MYEEITEMLETSKVHDNLIIGDFNMKVGIKKDEEEGIKGNFGSGTRNYGGDKLIEFAISKQLKIIITFDKKKYI